MKWHRLSGFVFLVLTVPVSVCAVQASEKVDVSVKTVLASQGAPFIDPELSGLVEELRSLFRYSSYRLLGKDRLSLNTGQTGTVSLPGQRVLKVTPTSIQEERVGLELVILKKNRQIFETVIQLLNNSSIIVGGPKHQDGSLLFNISASF